MCVFLPNAFHMAEDHGCSTTQLSQGETSVYLAKGVETGAELQSSSEFDLPPAPLTRRHLRGWKILSVFLACSTSQLPTWSSGWQRPTCPLPPLPLDDSHRGSPGGIAKAGARHVEHVLAFRCNPGPANAFPA